MKRLIKFLALSTSLLTVLTLALLVIGVWLPDVVWARRHVLADQQLASGYSFRVVQYWNRADFYSTELWVASPDGQISVNTLDGDDAKSWRLPLEIDEERRTAKVILDGDRIITAKW